MKNLGKKLISGALALGVAAGCAAPSAALAQENADAQTSVQDTALHFDENGKFKILILSDVQDTNTPQKATTNLLVAALDAAQPDLVVFLGDNIAGWWKGVTLAETESAIDQIIQPLDARGIPFAIVYGNHDHEGLCDEENGMTEEEAKEAQLRFYQKYKTCLAIEGEEMTGCGNYNLLIQDSAQKKNVFNLWFMDSNPYAPEEEGGGYGYVAEDQTQWYVDTSNALKAENGGEPLPSLLFQHIAVPEVYNMLTAVSAGTKGAVRGHDVYSDKHYVANSEYIDQGAVREGPCPPNSNHGQFESWKQQGNILGAFFGHDHINDYSGVYEGIRLTAAPAVGFYSYGNVHGVRTIELDENDLSTFTSEIIYYDDLVDEPVGNLIVERHGYYEYRNKFLPGILGGVAGLAVLGGAVAGIVKLIRKKRGS